MAALHALAGRERPGGGAGAPGVTRCEARVVFHRRFVAALELALSLHPVMAADVPTALGRTSGSSSSHANGSSSGHANSSGSSAGAGSGGGHGGGGVHVHSTTHVVTRDVALSAPAQRPRPSSASAAPALALARTLPATHAQVRLWPAWTQQFLRVSRPANPLSMPPMPRRTTTPTPTPASPG